MAPNVSSMQPKQPGKAHNPRGSDNWWRIKINTVTAKGVFYGPHNNYQTKNEPIFEAKVWDCDVMNKQAQEKYFLILWLFCSVQGTLTVS